MKNDSWEKIDKLDKPSKTDEKSAPVTIKQNKTHKKTPRKVRKTQTAGRYIWQSPAKSAAFRNSHAHTKQQTLPAGSPLHATALSPWLALSGLHRRSWTLRFHTSWSPRRARARTQAGLWGWKPGAWARFLPETSSRDKGPSCPRAGAGASGQGRAAQMVLLTLACAP